MINTKAVQTRIYIYIFSPADISETARDVFDDTKTKRQATDKLKL